MRKPSTRFEGPPFREKDHTLKAEHQQTAVKSQAAPKGYFEIRFDPIRIRIKTIFKVTFRHFQMWWTTATNGKTQLRMATLSKVTVKRLKFDHPKRRKTPSKVILTLGYFGV